MTRIQKAFTTIAASAVVVVLLFSAPTVTRAQTTNLATGQTISLATIIDNGLHVQIGDKNFADFSFLYGDNNGNALDDLTRSNVNLTALSNNIGFGLSFQQPLLAIATATNNIVLKYTVTVTDPGFFISDIHLSITGSAGNGGHGTVVEYAAIGDFFPGLGIPVGQLVASIPGSSTDQANILPPVIKLWVDKQVQVTGGTNANGFASITIIDQTFSQIPEPSTMLLVGLGLLGAVAVKRMRKS